MVRCSVRDSMRGSDCSSSGTEAVGNGGGHTGHLASFALVASGHHPPAATAAATAATAAAAPVVLLTAAHSRPTTAEHQREIRIETRGRSTRLLILIFILNNKTCINMNSDLFTFIIAYNEYLLESSRVLHILLHHVVSWAISVVFSPPALDVPLPLSLDHVQHPFLILLYYNQTKTCQLA